MFGKKTLNHSDLVELQLLEAALRACGQSIDPTLPVSIQRVDFVSTKKPDESFDHLKGLATIGTVSVRFDISIEPLGITAPEFRNQYMVVRCLELVVERTDRKCTYSGFDCSKEHDGRVQVSIPAVSRAPADRQRLNFEHHVRP